jgi:hypothetical protein
VSAGLEADGRLTVSKTVYRVHRHTNLEDFQNPTGGRANRVDEFHPHGLAPFFIAGTGPLSAEMRHCITDGRFWKARIANAAYDSPQNGARRQRYLFGVDAVAPFAG